MKAGRVLALAVCSLLLAGQLVAYADYFTDDSYIYARFATNLVERGEFVFNPGERIHAATSPVWALLLSALVAAGLPVVVGAKLLGAACALGALLVAERLARRRFAPGPWYPVFLLLLATEPWFVRWSASGMETPLAVLLVVLALEAGLRPLDAVAWGRLGWSLGLLPLVRPEAGLLVAVVAAFALASPVTRRRGAVWIGLACPALLWAAFAVPYYGAIVPATLQAKSTPLGLVPSRLLSNLLTLGALYLVALALPAMAWLVALVRSARGFLSARPDDWLLPALRVWTVVLPVAYLLRDVQVVSRYLEVVLPAVLVLGLDALSRLHRARLWSSLALVEVAAAAVLTLAWIVPSANAFGRSLDGLVEMGEWLAAHSERSDEVAAYDIGAIGWSSDRPVLDLGGLVNPGINDLRNEVDDAEILHGALFLDYGAPAFLVDRDPRGAVLDGTTLGGLRCETVLEKRVANLGLTRPEPVVYVLYRLAPAAP